MADDLYKKRKWETQAEYDKRIAKLLPPVFEGILQQDGRPLTKKQREIIERRMRKLKD